MVLPIFAALERTTNTDRAGVVRQVSNLPRVHRERVAVPLEATSRRFRGQLAAIDSLLNCSFALVGELDRDGTVGGALGVRIGVVDAAGLVAVAAVLALRDGDAREITLLSFRRRVRLEALASALVRSGAGHTGRLGLETWHSRRQRGEANECNDVVIDYCSYSVAWVDHDLLSLVAQVSCCSVLFEQKAGWITDTQIPYLSRGLCMRATLRCSDGKVYVPQITCRHKETR